MKYTIKEVKKYDYDKRKVTTEKIKPKVKALKKKRSSIGRRKIKKTNVGRNIQGFFIKNRMKVRLRGAD